MIFVLNQCIVPQFHAKPDRGQVMKACAKLESAY